MKSRIYHNPKCSKSRSALALLTERGTQVEVVEYLRSPPSRADLVGLLRKLALPALAIVRTGPRSIGQPSTPAAARATTS